VKILYVAHKYDYGNPRRGYSFEHYNFFDSLVQMGHDVLYFDFASLMAQHGRLRMNKRLSEVVSAERPELMFTVLFRNELDQRVIRDISQYSDTITLNWFCDDHWRFDSFSRHWAPNFNWVVTTAQSALPKYRLIGFSNVIKSQWACNHFLYRRLDLPPKYDATFVGLPHGDRRYVIELIRDAGIDIHVWGSGWPGGRISQERMIEVFNTSRVNLNLSNSVSARTLSGRATGLLLRRASTLPVHARVRSALLAHIARLDSGSRDPMTHRYVDQIKARNFEIPGCGGFELTGIADTLDAYYQPDREVGCFSSPSQLTDQLKHYLTHEDERAAVAEAGYQRTLRQHTYVHRFSDIFGHIGLRLETASDLLAGSRSGFVEEVV
jgi:spore maturation protein CgeB